MAYVPEFSEAQGGVRQLPGMLTQLHKTPEEVLAACCISWEALDLVSFAKSQR